MVSIRVTQGMLVDRSLSSLQSGLARMAVTQEKLSTGKDVNRPSDDPTASTTAMRLRADVASTEQHVRNAQSADGWLSVTDSALGTMADQVRRASDLALQAANATASGAGQEAFAAEIDQLRDSLLSVANTTYLGRPVLGGITAGSQAFDDSGAFVGVAGEVVRTIGPGVTVRIDALGTDVVGPDGANLFDDLGALSTAMRAGDSAGVQAGIAALAIRLTQITSSQATIGAAQNRVDATVNQTEDRLVSLKLALSEAEDTDLAAAVVEMQVHEVAYQAALASTARVLQPSLVDFLR
ncbi:MAG: flagellar hook-associated protein 3 [Nocardioides sp.]|nr:flagellar hook-associated protein 3 [Nocardioides sp.]